MDNKHYRQLAIASLLAGLLMTGADEARAQDDAETTIRLMGAAEATRPEAVTRDIPLPFNAAVDYEAVRGMAKAAERHERRENGLNTADKAKENAANMADEARSNRENRGRSDDIPGPPEDRPGPPEDRPGPPEDRPGPPEDRPGPPEDRPGPPEDRPGPPDTPGPQNRN